METSTDKHMIQKHGRLETGLDEIFVKLAITPPFREKIKGRKADIFLLPHKEMARLKKKFLPREKGPPNVLAFPEQKHWPYPEKNEGKLGEIYLNFDLAKGDIKKLSRLLIHGIVHLLGYDHKKKSDRMKMEKIEHRVDKILNPKH